MKKRETVCKAAQLRQGAAQPFGQMAQCVDLGAETELYRRVRSAVPVLDAAIGKLVRLTGGFAVRCGDARAQAELREFLRTVPTGRGQYGVECFLSAYLDLYNSQKHFVNGG